MGSFTVPVIIVLIVIVRLLVGRQIAKGRAGFAWIYFAPTLVGLCVAVWAGLTIMRVNVVAGILISTVSVISLILLGRMIHRAPTIARAGIGSFDLSGPWFDYFAWLAIGVPVILVVALVILALSGSFNSG